MSESGTLREVRLAVGGREDCRLFRNNVGVAKFRDEKTGNVRVVHYGLHKGSADLIGWRAVEITPDMVGQRVAVFVSIETKSARGSRAEDQKNWAQQVRAAGGLAGFARSVADAVKIILGD